MLRVSQTVHVPVRRVSTLWSASVQLLCIHSSATPSTGKLPKSVRTLVVCVLRLPQYVYMLCDLLCAASGVWEYVSLYDCVCMSLRTSSCKCMPLHFSVCHVCEQLCDPLCVLFCVLLSVRPQNIQLMCNHMRKCASVSLFSLCALLCTRYLSFDLRSNSACR